MPVLRHGMFSRRIIAAAMLAFRCNWAVIAAKTLH